MKVEEIEYVKIKRPVFITRGQAFDANGRKLFNLPNSDVRPDLQELSYELMTIINTESCISTKPKI